MCIYIYIYLVCFFLYICISIKYIHIFQIIFHYKLLQDIEYSRICQEPCLQQVQRLLKFFVQENVQIVMQSSLFLPLDVEKMEDSNWLLKHIRVCY